MKQSVTQAALTAVAIAFLSGCATQNQSTRTADATWMRWAKSDGGNGHYYKVVAVTNAIAWTEADKLARTDDGYLATITSQEENTFVFKLVDNPKLFISHNGSGPALGGFQQDGAKEPDGGWSWGNGDAWNFSNWWTDQPNNWPGSGINEDRMQFFSGVPGKPAATWNDLNRNDKVIGGYVIERDN